MSRLREELQDLIIRNSLENGSNTPDFILAEYLADCLAAFDKAQNARQKWYGESQNEPNLIWNSGPYPGHPIYHGRGGLSNDPGQHAKEPKEPKLKYKKRTDDGQWVDITEGDKIIVIASYRCFNDESFQWKPENIKEMISWLEKNFDPQPRLHRILHSNDIRLVGFDRPLVVEDGSWLTIYDRSKLFKIQDLINLEIYQTSSVVVHEEKLSMTFPDSKEFDVE